MKYHLTIWTDDGFKRELDVPFDAVALANSIRPNTPLLIMDTDGQEWFFNWNHVLGGTIRKIEEQK